MANGKEWLAYCSDCESITLMEHTGNRTEGICQECGKLQKLVDNPKILKELREISVSLENLHGRILMLQERRASLNRMLAPAEVDKKPTWERLTVAMACHKCDRQTNRAFNGLPHCFPNCKPRAGKVSVEDTPEVLDMLREYLAGGENDDNDFEVMKHKTPEDK